MAKREFIDVDKLSEQIKFEHNYLRAVFYEDKDISLADVDRAMKGIESTKKNKITEEEIVKPYLEKLKEQVEHEIKFWQNAGKDSIFDAKVSAYTHTCELIDNLLTEKGAEE